MSSAISSFLLLVVLHCSLVSPSSYDEFGNSFASQRRTKDTFTKSETEFISLWIIQSVSVSRFRAASLFRKS